MFGFGYFFGYDGIGLVEVDDDDVDCFYVFVGYMFGFLGLNDVRRK